MYTNKWFNDDTQEIIKSATRPDGEFIFPMYAKTRISKNAYRPYAGNSEWVKAANRAMAQAAS